MDSSQAQRDSAVAGARRAHQALIDDLASLTEEQARGASLLPEWSRGHLLTHLARNADAFVRMMRAALAGDAVSQYEGGKPGRAADIAAGADRPAADLVADVIASARALEQVWTEMTPTAWQGHGVSSGGEEWPCEAMPFHRWREVAIHRADLGLGYSPADWPSDYVDRELAVTLRLLPERLAAAEQQRVLAWLLGRTDQPASLDLGPW